MLPKKDGFTLAKDIRTVDDSVPILFLTAKSMKEDRIQGFKIGGDDYITKPFSMEELLLRIQAVMKRSGLGSSREKTDQFAIGDFILNYEKRELVRKGKTRKLTHKEAELLRLLCIHANRILERDMALNLIWGDNSIFNARSMDVYISKLRKYLKEDKRIEIMTVHGRGFRLIIRD
jgi:DNA-binding response OmpR family regulator